MPIRKYRVFNHTKKRFEYLITSAELEVAQFINLPQGELQIIGLVNIF